MPIGDFVEEICKFGHHGLYNVGGVLKCRKLRRDRMHERDAVRESCRFNTSCGIKNMWCNHMWASCDV